jgi:hypothetical protein
MKSQTIWIIVGYIFSIAGGLIGMIIAIIILNGKKTLAGGKTIHLFNERSRKHGKIILYLGSMVLVIAILFFMNWFFFEKLMFGKRGRL